MPWPVVLPFFKVERLLGRAALLDPARMVLRGFSMGGADAPRSSITFGGKTMPLAVGGVGR